MKVFWPGSGSGSGHVTLPIRKLVDTSVKLMETPGYRDSEVCIFLSLVPRLLPRLLPGFSQTRAYKNGWLE